MAYRSVFAGMALVMALGTAPRAGGAGPDDGKRPDDQRAGGGSRTELLPNGGFESGTKGWKNKGMRLVEDPRVAHRGKRCLMGEVFRRRQSRSVARKLDLRRDRLYRLSIWARASRGSRLTVWLSAAGQRRVVANWHGVERRWTRYRVNFTVPEDGPAVLEIAAPSSFWARVGRMWIDDLQLHAEPLMPQTTLSRAKAFADMPSLAQDGPGAAWACWLSDQAGRESIRVVRLVQADADHDLAPKQTWDLDLEEGEGALDPQVVSGSGGAAWLLYASERAGNWDLFAVPLGEEGPGAKLRLTRDPAVDVHPAGAVDGDTLWVAFESNRDAARRQIYLLALRDGRVGAPLRLSAPETDNYAPDLAVTGPGEVFAAWHSFRKDNFDLYGRKLSGGALGVERRLTDDPLIDRDVHLLVHEGALWLSWDQANYAGYFVGRASRKQVQIARLRGRRLQVPAGIRSTRLRDEAESASLAFDALGRMWVAALVPRDRNSGWDVLVWRFSKRGWSEPWVLSRRKGMNRRPGLAPVAGRVAVLYQNDDMPGRWPSYDDRHEGNSAISLGRVESGDRPPAGRLHFTPLEAGRGRFEAAAIRKARGEDRTGWEVAYKGQTYRLYFGDLHEHSDISVCDRTRDETPDQTFQMMRSLIRYDFGALTDHGKNFNDTMWRYTGKRSRANDDPGRFVTLRAQEWTSTFEKGNTTYPYGYYGHRNLIWAGAQPARWYNAADGMKPAALRRALAGQGGDYVVIPHQLADTGNVPQDWSMHDPAIETVAEIFQFRGSYECKGCPREAELSTPKGWFIQDAWARGTQVGVIAAPDHRGGHGKAAVYAPALKAGDLIDALKARRTYGTTGAKIFLDVRVAGHMMGEAGPRPGAGARVPIEIKVDCPGDIRSVVVLRNNKVVFRARPTGRRVYLTLHDRPPAGRLWYYVRVEQRDGELAWSSPVWLETEGSAAKAQ